MAKHNQLAGPMVLRRAGFQLDYAGRNAGKRTQESGRLAPAYAPRHLPLRVRAPETESHTPR